MPRLIDADALIDDVTERYCKDCNRRKGIKNGAIKTIYEIGEAPCRACSLDDMNGTLESAPTVDAVRHGHWEYASAYKGADFGFYKCTECGQPFWFKDMNYCPHCGAKMDEVEDERD